MGQADTLPLAKDAVSTERKTRKATAAGLFGYSIRDGRPQSFAPMIGYIRELEQLPNFTLPDSDYFVTQYVQSNIGLTRSTS